jgi:hypothetical protein
MGGKKSMKKDTGRNARAPFFFPSRTSLLENLFKSSILNPQSAISAASWILDSEVARGDLAVKKLRVFADGGLVATCAVYAEDAGGRALVTFLLLEVAPAGTGWMPVLLRSGQHGVFRSEWRFRLCRRGGSVIMSRMAVTETLKLPTHFDLEPELREQLSNRPGHQRCVEGAGELLLVVHEVPCPGVPEREALFFWKRHDGSWMQRSGAGLSGLGELLDRFAKAIDDHEEVIDDVDTAAEIFGILRHAGPLARTTRNLMQALEQVLAVDADDREIRSYRDRAREIDRAAELLYNDGRITLEFWRAERAEEHARSAARLNRIAFRLNLLAGFFLPLVAFGGLFGMNVDLPEFVKPMFWVILLGGISIGILLLWIVGHQTGKSSDIDAGPKDGEDDSSGK